MLRQVINTVTEIENLRTVLVECHGDDTSLTFHDTPRFSLLILLVHVNKFNVYGTSITLSLKLALGLPTSPQLVSHPEIFKFQDVIEIKNKTTFFS